MSTRPLNSTIAVAAALSAAAVLLLAGCRPTNTFVAPPPPEVEVAPPDQRDVTIHIDFPGRTEAVDVIELRARVRGYLESIHFDDGQQVKEGQLLFTIEQEPFVAGVEAARALLAQAEAARQLAETTLQRKEQAYETRAVSEIDLLTARAEKSGADAAVLAAQAEVDAAEIDLSYTKITAPVAGRISRRYVSAGNLVGGAEPTLLSTLVVEDPTHVSFNLDERQLLLFLSDKPRAQEPAGAGVDVLLELADGRRHSQTGIIDYVDNRIDPATGTLNARAVFENPGGTLLPGMFGRVLVPHQVPDAILIPDIAVLRDMTGSYVYIVGEGDAVETRHVTLGPRVDTERIITDGLAPQDRVVINGVQRLRPGARVTPVAAAADDEASEPGGAPPPRGGSGPDDTGSGSDPATTEPAGNEPAGNGA